jgi:hypothetical protein
VVAPAVPGRIPLVARRSAELLPTRRSCCRAGRVERSSSNVAKPLSFRVASAIDGTCCLCVSHPCN